MSHERNRPTDPAEDLVSELIAEATAHPADGSSRS